MMKMDSSPKQGLHGLGPKQEWIFIHDGLQVAQLMRQAELSFPSGSFQLGAPAIAPRDLCLRLTHDLLDHIHAAVEKALGREMLAEGQQDGKEHRKPQIGFSADVIFTAGRKEHGEDREVKSILRVVSLDLVLIRHAVVRLSGLLIP